MNLKSLTIHGFKSFAQRTTLEFSDGVAAVVGPNGSGKSNISDAIRWVLGEQSIRLLRGNRLEDVIFAGSDTKRPVGMAEVSLTFDNSSKRIPVDYAEVTVSRRVYRSGESEFSINRNPCRLRDIQELFMDTGLGKGSLAIIGQGEVDLILNARPEDRRAFLEEAAGITRYRVRKSEAMQRLAQTSEDLLRVGDIIAEIERQLEPLKKEAEAARTYQSLAEQLRVLEALLLWERKMQLEEKHEVAKTRHETILEERRTGQESLNRLEKEISAQETELDSVEAALDQARQAKEEARLVQTEARHRQEMAQERVAQGQREELERKKRLQELQDQTNALQHQLVSANKSLQDAEDNCSQVEGKIKQLTERKEMLRRNFEGHDQDFAKERARWQQMAEQLVLLKARRQSLSESVVQVDHRLQEHERTRDALEIDRTSAIEEVTRTQSNVEQLDKQLNQSAEDYAKAQEMVRRIESDQGEAERQLNEFIRVVHDSKARLKALEDMDESREGYHRGVKAVLQVAPSRGWDLKGAVAELLEVPEELEVAVEVALGASQQFIVAQSDRDAKGAIEFLKQNRMGRATFLPLDSLQPQRVPAEPLRQLDRINGAIGLAADLIRVPDTLRPAADYLLGRVAVAEDLDAALQISRTVRGFSRVVTLDGDVVVPGGAMTGGSRAGRSEGLLGRRRRLEQLQKEVAEIEEKVSHVKGRLQKLHTQGDQVRRQLEDLDRHRRQLELIKHTAVRDLQEARLRKERAESDVQNWLREKERLVGEKERVDAEINRCTQEMHQLEVNQKKLNDVLQTREKEVEAFRREEDVIREEMNELQITLAALAQNREHKHAEIQRLTNDVQDLRRVFQEEEERLQALLTEQARVQEMIGQAQKEMQQAQEKLDDTAKEERQLIERRERIRQIRNELGAKVKDVQEILHHVQTRLTKSEVELDRLNRELDSVKSELDERGISARPIPEIESDMDLHQLERESRRIKSRLEAIGPVSLNSIKEFEAVSERHTFLTEQKEDLEQAKEKLHQVIARIDKESRAKFDALFTQVQKEFSQVFTRLFHGGKARLELLDPDNPLESGVDILVQPPGKRLQNLLALSGGERALAAIALLFAILAVRPSPFCVLDEIDAALDEHNLTRFRDLLKEFSASTQFLVITHRQGTMESADCLFGVTMEDSGVSRLVSLNLDDVKTA